MLPFYLQLLTFGLALSAPVEYLQRQDGNSNYRFKSQNAMVAVILPDNMISVGAGLMIDTVLLPMASFFIPGGSRQTSRTPEPETDVPEDTHKTTESSTGKESASTSVPEDADSQKMIESSNTEEPTSTTTDATNLKDTNKTTETSKTPELMSSTAETTALKDANKLESSKSNSKDEGEQELTLKRRSIS